MGGPRARVWPWEGATGPLLGYWIEVGPGSERSLRRVEDPMGG